MQCLFFPPNLFSLQQTLPDRKKGRRQSAGALWNYFYSNIFKIKKLSDHCECFRYDLFLSGFSQGKKQVVVFIVNDFIVKMFCSMVLSGLNCIY